MLKDSTKRICLPGILPGMVVGVVIGFLLTGSSASRGRRPFNLAPASQPDVARLSFVEIAGLPKSTLSSECGDTETSAGSGAPTGEPVKQRSLSGETAVRAGITNTRRLLPLAKKLSIKALIVWVEHNGAPAQNLTRSQQKINKVDRVILDGALGGAAGVRDDRPREIRIGSGYAETLISDDEAVFLLAHELTHVAAETGELDGFVESVSRKAKVASGVEMCADQEEDLACDFIGAQVLKHFIDLYPTDESKAERLLRTCGYELPSERLARAWDDFCASYNGYTGDTHHLSQDLTVRALAGLDPELKAFIDRSSTTTTAHNPEHQPR
jgi:hypothetical protein